jgi:hypothetical protein
VIDTRHEEATGALLRAHRGATVPLLIHEMRRRGGPDAADWGRCLELGQRIAECGDRILYRSGKRGETAALVTDLARALALLAFVPGGVTFLGLHFEATP